MIFQQEVAGRAPQLFIGREFWFCQWLLKKKKAKNEIQKRITFQCRVDVI